MSIIEILITIGYLAGFILSLAGLYFLFKFVSWLLRKLGKLAHPDQKYLNRRLLKAEMTQKYGHGQGKKITASIIGELKKRGIK